MPEDFEDLPSTLQRSPESARKTFAEAKESAEGTYGKGERASRTSRRTSQELAEQSTGSVV